MLAVAGLASTISVGVIKVATAIHLLHLANATRRAQAPSVTLHCGALLRAKKTKAVKPTRVVSAMR